MSKYRSWLPGKREDQIKMADAWVKYIHGGQGSQKSVVPVDVYVNLKNAFDAAVKENSIPKTERTLASNARLRIAMKDLIDIMRDIKKRYFFTPPLTEEDYVLLGIKPRDTVLTPIAAPTAVPLGSIAYPRKGRIKVERIIPTGELGDPRSRNGIKAVCLTDEGIDSANVREAFENAVIGAGPAMTWFTRRNYIFVDLPGRSGKKIYLGLRYENSKGEAGPWSEIMEIFVP
jgi:hypothetical protein